MRNPAAFGGWFGVIDLAMTVAMALYAAVGFYGYLKFGDDVQGSITLNLPCHQGSVSLCVCLSNPSPVPCHQGSVSVCLPLSLPVCLTVDVYRVSRAVCLCLRYAWWLFFIWGTLWLC